MMRQRGRNARGSVMVQALIVLAGLVALMGVLAANEFAALQQVQNRLRQRRADLAARSAIARALAVVQAANTNVVTLNDDWALLGDNGNVVFDVGDSTTTFRVQVVDAGSLINLNMTSRTQLQSQLQMLPLTPQQSDSLLDWLQTGETPRANGAKDSYYDSLSQPYYAKLGPLLSINDLLLIQGWTGQTLLSPQTSVVTSGPALQDANGNQLPLIDVLTADGGMPNRQASGTARINISARQSVGTWERLGIPAATATQLANNRTTYASLAAILRQPWATGTVARNILNEATVSAGTRLVGKININTASLSVLETIPSMTQSAASAIVQQQSSGFTTLGTVASVAGLTGTRLAQVADALGIGSDTWVVRAYGESGGVGAAYEVVIGMRNSLPKVVTWNRLSNTSVPAWWDWPNPPTGTMNAGDSVTSTGGTGGSTSGSMSAGGSL